jgi:hypothetical protein
MPRVGYEPTTPVFERARMIHALDRAAALIGSLHNLHTLCSLQVWLTMMSM